MDSAILCRVSIFVFGKKFPELVANFEPDFALMILAK